MFILQSELTVFFSPKKIKLLEANETGVVKLGSRNLVCHCDSFKNLAGPWHFVDSQYANLRSNASVLVQFYFL